MKKIKEQLMADLKEKNTIQGARAEILKWEKDKRFCKTRIKSLIDFKK